MKMKKKDWVIVVGICVLVLMAVFPVTALGVPGVINCQGNLREKNGYPLDGHVDIITFRIWNTEVGGNSPLWSESHSNVAVNNGVYSVLLGSASANHITADMLEGDHWLGISVGSDSEMTPRMKITSVAYAVRAAYAESAPGLGKNGIPIYAEGGTSGKAGVFMGKVGIGTDDPKQDLHIKSGGNTWIQIESAHGENAGITLFEGEDQRWLLVNDGDEQDRFRIMNQDLKDILSIDQNGNVGIGTSNPKNKLDVVGTIRAEEIIVDTGWWPDHVFQKGYHRMGLKDVEDYIKETGHLPGIPAAGEVERNGIRLGEFQSKLLEKIEELTLHVIDQKKEIDLLKREIGELKGNGR